jgi:hypothetical protein
MSNHFLRRILRPAAGLETVRTPFCLENVRRMIKRITGLFMILASTVIILLFPALATPRQKLPSDGQDWRAWHADEVAKQNRYHILTMRVCVPAGVVLGIGFCMFMSGVGRRKGPNFERGSTCLGR